jgi:hypothetical protein
MNPELQELESALRTLRPASPDARLLDRLELACGRELTESDPFLKATEAGLASVPPAALPPHLAARAETILSRVPHDRHAKVVSFDHARRSAAGAAPARKPAGRPGFLAAAAAVALCGALLPFLLDPSADSQRPPAVAENAAASAPSAAGAPTPARSSFVPAGFSSGLSDASDLGVMWSDDRRPMRVVRVVYTDKATLLNDEGEEVVVEVPRVEYVVVPEKID